MKNVLKHHSRSFDDIYKRTKTILSNVYGLKLYDLEKQKFILVNKHKINTDLFDRSNEKYFELGLLFPVLAIIFMNNNEMKEGKCLIQYNLSIKLVFYN